VISEIVGRVLDNGVIGNAPLATAHSNKQLTGLRLDRDGGKWPHATLKNEQLSGHFLRRGLIKMWERESKGV